MSSAPSGTGTRLDRVGKPLRQAAWFGLPLLVGGTIVRSHPQVLFLVGFLVAGLWLAAATVAARRSGWDGVFLVLAAIMFSLAGGEAFIGLLAHHGPVLGDVNRRALNLRETIAGVYDPDLGFRPRPDQRATATASFQGRTEFAIAYTIGPDGLRVMPAVPDAPCHAVFFGDSFAFGYGLEDGQAMPYQFVTASAGRYAAVNFAYNGYGPHQMLRALEIGRVDQVARGPVQLVVYEGIVNHLARVTGHQVWDPFGPAYVVAQDGQARYAGPFHGRLYARIISFLDTRSETFHYLDWRFLAPDRPDAADLATYIAILKQARQEVERRYGAAFVVLFWNTDSDSFSIFHDGALAAATMQQLIDAGFDVVPITRIIPDIDTNRSAYALSALDLHPNAAADQRIGAYLAREAGPRFCPRPSEPGIR
ncbi:MAG TPA: hypothetical protein VF502_18615 [Stellaceae bacterium]